jgi:hypothetical protein
MVFFGVLQRSVYTFFPHEMVYTEGLEGCTDIISNGILNFRKYAQKIRGNPHLHKMTIQ